MISALVILAAIPATVATPRQPCRVVYAPLAYRAAPVRCRPMLPRQFVDRP